MGEQEPQKREFDPTQFQWATVECVGCDERYVCTPQSDYYGSNGVTNDDGIFIDGKCEECLLKDMGMVHSETPTQIGPNEGLIGEAPRE